MGLKNYFKANKAAAEKPPMSMTEKPMPAPGRLGDNLEMSHTPHFGSSRASIAPSTRSSFVDDIKHEVMVNYLYQQQCSHLWVSDGSGELEGVLLRKSRNNYMACPPQLAHSSFAVACAALNCAVCDVSPPSGPLVLIRSFQVAMTVNSRVIKTFLQWSPDAVDVPLMNGLRIQILPTIDDLPRARKHQFAAFIASEALLVVWDDEALHLVQRAKSIESELMELVWKTGEPDEAEPSDSKKGPNVTEIEIDEESGEIIPERRATHLLNTILVAFTLVLIVTVLGAGFRELAIELAVDHNMMRMAFLLLTPVQVFFTLVSGATSELTPMRDMLM